MALRSSPENPQPLGRIVAEVTGWVGKLGQVWVDAQVIELRRRAGANVHFLKLRDRYAEVSANVICSSEVLDRAGPLIEGSQVVALVKPRIWNKTASLSFECSEIRICGEGQLLAELERRKRQLQAEGLFDLDRKQKLPFLPKAIGLIAGQNSDAERDVRTHIARRWPVANIVFKPALVQGPDAAQTIVKGLAELVENPKVEVIVIARGGGSLEDL
ncbi:MAG: exodeoxyribonuclease VII large subunit, partial [Propionibacterium sp.]